MHVPTHIDFIHPHLILSCFVHNHTFPEEVIVLTRLNIHISIEYHIPLRLMRTHIQLTSLFLYIKNKMLNEHQNYSNTERGKTKFVCFEYKNLIRFKILFIMNNFFSFSEER